jgi:hypothetical protein
MATPKRYRWTCPVCETSVLAGKAPRRNATVRFCLACSAKSDTLVERTCPVLAQTRLDREHKRRNRVQQKREAEQRKKDARAREAARSVEKRATAIAGAVGDLRVELARLWPLARTLATRAVPIELPALTLRNRAGSDTTGRAWWGDHRIHLSVAREDDSIGVNTVLAHEVAHLVARGVHGRVFWNTFIALVQLAYGATVDVDAFARETSGWGRHSLIESAVRAARSVADV